MLWAWTTTAAPVLAGTNTAVSCRRLLDARDQLAKGRGGSCSPVAPTEADIPEESVASVNGAIVVDCGRKSTLGFRVAVSGYNGLDMWTALSFPIGQLTNFVQGFEEW
jgi:hypothetical protein